MSFPATLAQDVLRKGLEIVEIVDEIYIQLCKQLTQNPRKDRYLTHSFSSLFLYNAWVTIDATSHLLSFFFFFLSIAVRIVVGNWWLCVSAHFHPHETLSHICLILFLHIPQLKEKLDIMQLIVWEESKEWWAVDHQVSKFFFGGEGERERRMASLESMLDISLELLFFCRIYS